MFKLIKNVGHLLYRIWFYMLAAIPILIFSPLLLLTTFSEKMYPQFYWLARNIWAKTILYGMGCFPKVNWEESLQKGKNYMLVANHTSMLDIMLMLYVSKNPFVFVGKYELAQIPVFGFFYRRVCILVDRDNVKSRSAVYKQVQHRLKQGLNICIFPEGGVPEEHIILDKFKDGAFKMAANHDIPIVPITFLDCKKRFSWTFFSGGPGVLRVSIAPFIQTNEPQKNNVQLFKESARNIILSNLEQDK